MQRLDKILNAALKFNGPDFYKNQVPTYLYDNLRKKFKLRPYQQEALGRFNFFWKDYHDRSKDLPTQVLYHMATGSGKTLIMAGLIIYLYEQGYRNFLFFVNSSNIIDKTKDNFLNKNSSKYLFSNYLSIGQKQIEIKEVDNFQASNQDDINIVFSTIQGLHTRLNSPSENAVTFDDFEDSKIVLISDEAHHINAETKKKSQLKKADTENILSWENTVNRILNAHKDNVLLEFTATADLTIPQLEDKYNDKLIFDYNLKQFRIDGYSKEVKVLQSDVPQFDRALQSLILSQYRRKVFEKHKKLVKPVILFKSKTIKASQEFLSQFINGIKSLKVSDLEEIKNSKSDEIIKNTFKYFEDNNITLENLITELKEDFSEDKLISVNSKNESKEKQIAVNSLEDQENEYRAVFAVDKLNEGWDVLNLFDIVRLYDTRDAKKGVPGKTTMSEAQLIGRGARYCPFQISDEQELFKRKYDDDIKNELRICEELYYHSSYNPKYIQELKTALEKIGIKAKQSIERSMKLKTNFKQTPFYKDGLIYLNSKQKYNGDDIFGLKPTLLDQTHKVNLKTGYTKSSIAFDKTNSTFLDRREREYNLSDFGEHIVRKALNKLEFYKFSNLRLYLPNLKSISEFVTSKSYLGKVSLDVAGLEDDIENLTPKHKLDVTIQVLENISKTLAADKVDYKGSKEFKPFMVCEKITDKVLNFTLNENGDSEFGRSMINPTETSYHLDLSNRDWYAFEDCFGTSEEKLLIKFIDKVYSQLKSKFDEIFLVRNEKHFKIYNFEDGRPTEPDFVLFMVNHQPKESMHYQIFIEPKGEHLLKKDAWKEKFLMQLRDEHRLDKLWKDKNYTIWGMPFYNEKLTKSKFQNSLNSI